MVNESERKETTAKSLGRVTQCDWTDRTVESANVPYGSSVSISLSLYLSSSLIAPCPLLFLSTIFSSRSVNFCLFYLETVTVGWRRSVTLDPQKASFRDWRAKPRVTFSIYRENASVRWEWHGSENTSLQVNAILPLQRSRGKYPTLPGPCTARCTVSSDK